jgi:ribose transport system substrate-binding protein
VNSNGKANVLVLNISAYTILEFGTKLFQGELKRVCPACKTTVLDNKPTDVGTNLPAAVVSALQRDPSINYVAFSFGDMSLGVANALKGAGLSKILPHMVSFGSASPSNLNAINQGNFGATAGWSIPFNGWQAIDTFARYFNGDKIPTTMPMLQGMVVTSKTAKSQYTSDTNWEFAGPKNYAAQFKKLWHAG